MTVRFRGFEPGPSGYMLGDTTRRSTVEAIMSGTPNPSSTVQRSAVDILTAALDSTDDAPVANPRRTRL